MTVTFDHSIIGLKSRDTQNAIKVLTWNGTAYTHNFYTQATTTTFDYFRDDAGVGDIIYFFWMWEMWHDLKLNIDTPLVADAITIVWEYLDYNNVWQTLTVTDNSNMFQNSGSQIVEFTPPDDWRYSRILTPNTEYSGAYGNFIRARITSVTNLTEGGANGTNAIDGKDWTVQITGTETLPTIYTYMHTTLGNNLITRTGKNYAFNCNFRIGDALATATTFTMLNEGLQIGYRDATTPNSLKYSQKHQIFAQNATDTWNMGTSTGDGCNLELNVSGNVKSPYNYIECKCNWYNSHCAKENGGYNDGGMRYTGKVFENCIFSPWQTFFLGSGSGGSFTNCIIDVNTTWWYIYSGGWTFDNIQVIAGTGILAQGCTLANTNYGSKVLYCYRRYNYLIDCTITDVTSAITNSTSRANSGGAIQYHYNVDVIEEDGTAMTANVKIVDNEDTTIYNSDSSVDQLLTTYDSLVGASPPAKVVTNYNPFTITVTKAGYVTYEEIVTITQRIDKKITLKPSPKFTLSTDGNVSKYLNPDNPKNLGLVLPL